jgi:hypothetical protein
MENQLMGEVERARAMGKRRLARVKAQRDVDVTAAEAKVAAIATLRTTAVAAIGDDSATGAALATMATRLTELTAILTAATPAEEQPGESGPNVGPIITNLGQAKTAAALHTTQGRTDATTAFNAAKTKINALNFEVVTDAIAAIDAGIANIVLATTPGDNAAIVNADAAIAAVRLF